MGTKDFEVDPAEIYRCGTWFDHMTDDINRLSFGAQEECANAEGFDCLLLKPLAEAMPALRELIDEAFDLLSDRVTGLGTTLQSTAHAYATSEKEKADLLNAVVEANPSGTHNGPGI